MKQWMMVMMVCLSACVSEGSKDSSQQEMASDENVQLGVAYLEQHNMDAAKSHLLLALDGAPHSVMALDAMGYYYEVIQEGALAMGYYQRALQVAPTSGVALNNFGGFLCRQGQYLAAIQAFRVAVKDDRYTHVAKAYENAGVCALMAQDKVQAKALLLEAIKKDPLTPTARINLAQLYFEEGQQEEAKNQLRIFLSVHEPTALTRALGEKL